MADGELVQVVVWGARFGGLTFVRTFSQPKALHHALAQERSSAARKLSPFEALLRIARALKVPIRFFFHHLE
jgi:hypothetical protein